MNLRQQLAADLAGRISGSTAAIDHGHGCLMIDNRIFAFTRPDESAALKLPEDRIAELISDGEIRHLIMGKRLLEMQINSARNVEEGRGRTIEALVRKPG